MRLVKGLLQRCTETVELMAARRGPHRLSDIAAALGMPKSATHRLLQELQALGWVDQNGSDSLYQLSTRFALLGYRVMDASGLPELVRPVLAALAEHTLELVRLTVATDGGLSWLASAQGATTGLLYQPDMDGPVRLFATANGKAFLATLDDAEALALAVRDGLGRVRPTRRSHKDGRTLLADLKRVRARGHALAEEEAEAGVSAVSVAVRSEDKVVGTLSVAGPSLRIIDRVDVLAHELRQAASTLGLLWPRDAQVRAAIS